MRTAPTEVVAAHVAALLGQHYGVDPFAVRMVMDEAPLSLDALLGDPRGWIALGEIVRGELGGRGREFMPTLHRSTSNALIARLS